MVFHSKNKKEYTLDQLLSENEILQSRLKETEEALNAIRNGEADAIVVSGINGEKIFSLGTAETPYRIILEQMNEGAVTLTADGTILYCNKSFAKLLLMPIEKTVGSSIFNYISEGENIKFNRILKRGIKGRAKGVITFKRGKDNIIHLNLSIHSLSSDFDADVCILASDITHEKNYRTHLENLVKKRTAAIKEAKEKFDVALENGNIGVWEWNLSTNGMVWDKRMKKIFSLEDETLNQTYSTFEDCLNEEDLTHFRKAVESTLKLGSLLETVVRTRPFNGNSNYISLKALVNKDPGGKPVSLSGVCFDITGMKRGTEEVLIKLNEELLRSNKDLEQFAYVASHDLQEPLRMVSFFSQKLGDAYRDKLDQDANDYIKFAVDGSKRMFDLINGLLEYSRVQTKGKNFSRVDMNDVLKKVFNNLKLKIKENSAVINVKPEKLPVVIADENQMVQLMQNLISNALKFSKEYPLINISATSGEDKYVFSVRDHGIGIEPQYRERIFKIFQRLVRADEYEGIGVGLAICKRIVERHGGEIWVKSLSEKGTTFMFSLPKLAGLSPNPSPEVRGA